MTDCLELVFDVIAQWFAFDHPFGITFGALVVGIFGAPILVKAWRKFF